MLFNCLQLPTSTTAAADTKPYAASLVPPAEKNSLQVSQNENQSSDSSNKDPPIRLIATQSTAKKRKRDDSPEDLFKSPPKKQRIGSTASHESIPEVCSVSSQIEKSPKKIQITNDTKANKVMTSQESFKSPKKKEKSKRRSAGRLVDEISELSGTHPEKKKQKKKKKYKKYKEEDYLSSILSIFDQPSVKQEPQSSASNVVDENSEITEKKKKKKEKKYKKDDLSILNIFENTVKQELESSASSLHNENIEMTKKNKNKRKDESVMNLLATGKLKGVKRKLDTCKIFIIILFFIFFHLHI